MFGPLDLDRQSPTYGHITATPKAGWSEADIVGPLFDAYRIPISSTKSMSGHLLGGAGAFEAVAGVMAIRDGIVVVPKNGVIPDGTVI